MFVFIDKNVITKSFSLKNRRCDMLVIFSLGGHICWVKGKKYSHYVAYILYIYKYDVFV